MSTTNFKRYAVTFIENHDTQYRDENNQNDPLRADTLAANAYLLTMPGTPCVFLPHWKAYKQEIKNMIEIRKTVGVTNTSTAQKYTISKSYEMSGFKSSGANGKAMYCIVGNNKYTRSDNVINQYYSTIIDEAVQVVKGYGYRLFMSKNCETAWADKASGKYKGTLNVMLSAVTTSSGAQLVYTLDGSTPTASSTKVESGSTINIYDPCTLKVGILSGGTVKGIITREYTFSAPPKTIKVYVNAQSVGWNPVRYYTWDQDDVQHNGNWPGEVATATEEYDGHTFYVKEYTLADDDCYMNFVFNTGSSGSPQTLDVMFANTDKYYVITNQKQDGKYVVVEYEPGMVIELTGDVNGDGFVTSADVTAIYDVLLGIDTTFEASADVNGDGYVTSADVTAVYDILLGN